MRNRKRWGVAGGLAAVSTTLALVVGLGAGAGTAAVAAAPQNTSPPTITGTPQEGKKLVGHRGTLERQRHRLRRPWQRCDEDGGSCANISGATDGAAGYILKKVDVGNTIRFRVTAKTPTAAQPPVSVPTAVIKAAAHHAPAAEARSRTAAAKRPTASSRSRKSHRLPASSSTRHRYLQAPSRSAQPPSRPGSTSSPAAPPCRAHSSTSPPSPTTSSRSPTSSPPAPTAGQHCR